MEKKCGYCGRNTLSLRRCSSCQDVYYCSTVCQHEDWRGQHKVRCKEIQKRKETGSRNSHEDASLLPKKENGNGTVLYPPIGASNEEFVEYFDREGMSFLTLTDMLSGSVDAYKEDPVDQNTKRKRDNTINKTCYVCGETSAVVKTCARCKMVNYCSQDCQKKDRKRHKIQCKEPKEQCPDTNTTMDGSAFFRSMPKMPDLSIQSYSEPGALAKAKSLAWRAFPDCTVLDFIREIPPELFGMRPRGTSRVAVGFISRFHRNMMRHCIFLQDKDGDEVYVAFYLERDDPRPYFRWDDVVPGRYICIEDPYIHPFMDGSVGIRVDFPSAVRVFAV
ncbi:uncharacterized protein LOC117342620 isoform X2 [Pecten maximus]|nr:uncharacterized protein LOC117342620 isoform X2 [Pecten maximus]